MNRPLSLVATFGVAAMLFAPAASFAQSAPGPLTAPAASSANQPRQHQRRGSRYMHALRSLDLNDAQRQQIRGFTRSSAKQLRAQIDGVLTPAQRAQLRSQLQESRPATKPAT